MFELYREMIELHARLGSGLRLIVDAAPGLLAFERGDHLVALNLSADPASLGPPGAVEVVTRDGALDAAGRLAPRAAAVLRLG